MLTATVVVLWVKKKRYLRFDDEESKGNTDQTSNKTTAVAIEMTISGSGAKRHESSVENPLQAVQVVQTKNNSFFDSAAAAPPEERIPHSRVQIKKRSLPMSSISSAATVKGVVVTTEMGKGILKYERPIDQCRVFELEWKLAGDSKAILYSYK